MADTIDDMINDPEGRALVEDILDRKRVDVGDYSLDLSDPSLPPGEGWVMHEGRTVGWMKAGKS